ncbi:MAG: hypothetical protein ABI651_19300 [Verrucomicrobiota bacterium]
MLSSRFCADLEAATFTVPGTANPWLAGMTNGATASGDTAPANSPVLFDQFFGGSATLQFSATGLAGFAPGAETGPEGTANYPVTHSAENGIGPINNSPANALLGVFLDDAQPTLTGAPPALDFATIESQNYRTLSPTLKQPFFIGDGVTTNGEPQSVVPPPEATRLFLGITDGSGWYNNPGAFTVTVINTTPAPLPAFGSFSYTTSAPIRSGQPWQFTAVQSAAVSEVRVRVQSTLTPNNETSWTDLPGGGQMTHVDANWSLNTMDVPSGVRYFRAIASAPRYQDSISTSIGPITIEEGLAPFGDFNYQTTSPARTGTPWIFTIIQRSLFSGLRLRAQSSATPADETSWRDLPGGGQMGHLDDIWTLTTADLPAGTQSFRIVASAPGNSDRISSALGPFAIGAPLPVVTKMISGKGQTYSLASLPETQDPTMLIVQAHIDASVFWITDPNRAVQIIVAAMTIAAEQYSSARLTIDAGQSLITPGLNVGPNSSLVLKGTINGDVSTVSSLIAPNGASLITNDGGSAISHDGGSLTANWSSGSLISTAAPIVGNDGHSLISNDGGSLISNDGGSFKPQGLTGNKTPPPPAERRRVSLASAAASSAIAPVTGVMTINGNLNLAPATALSIAIAGTNSASNGIQDYDQLLVSGRADLGGVIGFGLFDAGNVANAAGAFQPSEGATFDVVVANQIVTHHLLVRGPIWGDGLHFNWSVVNRSDGKKALRLVAVRIAPPLIIQKTGSALQLAYPTNFQGYVVQTASSLNSSNWTTFATNTNRIDLKPASTSAFFRLSKQ